MEDLTVAVITRFGGPDDPYRYAVSCACSLTTGARCDVPLGVFPTVGDAQRAVQAFYSGRMIRWESEENAGVEQWTGHVQIPS